MGLTILIIEDNEQNMYLLTYLLEERYVVYQAFNGLDGVVMAREKKPDIILLDIQLPEMDGYTIAAALRKYDDLKDTPIIAVTSYAMVGDRERIMAAGATGYIEKPIDPDRFIGQMIGFLPETLKQRARS